MFLAPTRTLICEATRAAFGPDHPVTEYRDLPVSLEAPTRRLDIPGIWVDFVPATEAQSAGINHVEYTAPADDGTVRALSRWRFSGYVTWTVMALGSLERDRLADALFNVIAFGAEHPPLDVFRRYIERNDLVGLGFNWDRIALSGRADAPGTPWGTSEWVYEQTVQVECQGEVLADPASATLVPLSAVVVTPYTDLEGDPDPLSPVLVPPNRYNPYDWQ